ETGQNAPIQARELELANRLIEELSSKEFKPEMYHDEYRNRVLEVVESKVEGREITSVAEHVQQTQVIDLMDALKQSLEKRLGGDAADGKAPEKKPAARAKRAKAEPETREREGSGGEG